MCHPRSCNYEVLEVELVPGPLLVGQGCSQDHLWGLERGGSAREGEKVSGLGVSERVSVSCSVALRSHGL